MTNENIVKCSRCGKTLIDDEYASHSCMSETIAIRKVNIDFFTVTRDRNGRKVIMAQGLDGIMYVLTEIKDGEAAKIPFASTTQKSTPKRDTDRFNNTNKVVLLH